VVGKSRDFNLIIIVKMYRMEFVIMKIGLV
jgi:hypothetical protein